jgi:hypothetical protein
MAASIAALGRTILEPAGGHARGADPPPRREGASGQRPPPRPHRPADRTIPYSAPRGPPPPAYALEQAALAGNDEGPGQTLLSRLRHWAPSDGLRRDASRPMSARRIRSARVQEGTAGVGPSFISGSASATPGASAGRAAWAITGARQLACGARTPWESTRLIRGHGMNAASFSSTSSGSNRSFRVPSAPWRRSRISGPPPPRRRAPRPGGARRGRSRFAPGSASRGCFGGSAVVAPRARGRPPSTAPSPRASTLRI